MRREKVGTVRPDRLKKFVECIKQSKSFTSPTAAIKWLARKMDVGESVIPELLRQTDAIIVYSKRKGIYSVHLRSTNQAAAA